MKKSEADELIKWIWLHRYRNLMDKDKDFGKEIINCEDVNKKIYDMVEDK
jgi:hypothetical protein